MSIQCPVSVVYTGTPHMEVVERTNRQIKEKFHCLTIKRHDILRDQNTLIYYNKGYAEALSTDQQGFQGQHSFLPQGAFGRTDLSCLLCQLVFQLANSIYANNVIR